jgi:hypothetical protein
MLAKKQQPAVAPSDGELISCGQTAAQGVIDRHVEALKASHDGAGIPRETLLQMTMAGSHCVCRVAQYILSKERK